MNKKEVILILHTIGKAFPEVKITEGTIDTYFNSLLDLDFETTKVAIKQIIETSEFFPRIATIRKKVAEMQNPDLSANTTDGLLLLGNTIRKFGRYRYEEALSHLEKENPLIFKIVKSIGYGNICNSDINKFRTEFEIIYKEVQKSTKENAMLSAETQARIQKLSNNMRQDALLLSSDNY